MFYNKAGNHWDDVCMVSSPLLNTHKGLKAPNKLGVLQRIPFFDLDELYGYSYLLSSGIHSTPRQPWQAAEQKIRTQWLWSATNREGEGTQTPLLRFGMSWESFFSLGHLGSPDWGGIPRQGSCTALTQHLRYWMSFTVVKSSICIADETV